MIVIIAIIITFFNLCKFVGHAIYYFKLPSYITISPYFIKTKQNQHHEGFTIHRRKKRAPKVRLYTFISLSIQITLGFGNINIHCEFPKNLIFLT